MPYRKYLLAVLSIIGALNAAEGMALGLVMQNIKHDFSLTDTQLGLLTGFAFALFYALAGIAIARWADRGNRVVIISLATAAWGILLAVCGLATSFVQLILLRVGLGIGEAGCLPVSQSLIADYFSRAERLRANGVYFASVASITQIVGYGVAGRLSEVYGWRMMFVMLGMPGLALAILAWFTLREPRFEKPQNRATTADALAPVRLKEALVTLWSNTTLRYLILFWSVWGFVSIGVGRSWPVFFVRSYGLQPGELGIWFACIFGLGGTLSPLLGSAWCSRYAANNERLQLRAMAVVSCVLTILSPFIYLVHDYHVAFGVLGLYAMLTLVFIGTFWAIVQTVVPNSMRAAATAVLMLIAGLIGAGLGPLATGVLSDALRAQLGDDSLPYASLVLSPGFLWAAWYLWQASKFVTGDLAATQEQHDRASRGASPVAGLA